MFLNFLCQKLATLTLLLCVVSSNSWACLNEEGFVPNGNSFSIPTTYHNFLNPNAVTEEAFNQVSNDLQNLYQPVVKERGAVLKVVKNWKSDKANAYANRSKNTYKVHMFGGLARHPMNTIDGFTLVLCHEIGHHLAGKPLASKWASNEGQSDYFATAKCLRKYLATQDNAAVVATMTVPEKVQTHCFKSFGPSRDHAICVRGSLAGLALGNVLNALSSGSGRTWGKPTTTTGAAGKPDFETPDLKVVKTTYPGHPKAQCRLDTYFAGAVCEVPSTQDFSYSDEKTGACAEGVSARPACWYAAQ